MEAVTDSGESSKDAGGGGVGFIGTIAAGAGAGVAEMRAALEAVEGEDLGDSLSASSSAATTEAEAAAAGGAAGLGAAVGWMALPIPLPREIPCSLKIFLSLSISSLNSRIIASFGSSLIFGLFLILFARLAYLRHGRRREEEQRSVCEREEGDQGKGEGGGGRGGKKREGCSSPQSRECLIIIIICWT
jgi:hypothetical protein